MFLRSYSEIVDCVEPLAVKAIRFDGWDLTNLVKKISTFVNLELFELNWGGNSFAIPVDIFKLPKLKHLSFTKIRLSKIPETIVYAENLETLDLSYNLISKIPAYLTQLKQLKVLNLSKNPIEEIEEECSSMNSLKSLNISTAKFEKIPATLLKILPQISEIWLPKKIAAELKKNYKAAYWKLPFISLNSSTESKLLKKILQIFRSEGIDFPSRAFILNLSANNKEKIREQANKEFLLTALKLKSMEAIRLRALDYIGEIFSEEGKTALQNNAKLAVLGKLGINKNELRLKMKNHNIKYTSKIDKSTTHILLGQSPGAEAEAAFEPGKYILNEKNIIDFWEISENPYILELASVTTDQLDNLSNMMLSGQDDSIMVALSMFKQGGFPKALITELFIIFKTINDPLVLREAERLLRQYGSTELIGKLKTEQYLFHYKHNESNTMRSIRNLSNKTELDGLKIARYLHRKYSTAAGYLAKYLSDKEAVPFFEQLIDANGKLNLSGLALQAVPSSIFLLGNKVKILILSSNGLKSVSEQIKNLKELKLLDLNRNSALKANVSNRTKLNEWLPECKILF